MDTLVTFLEEYSCATLQVGEDANGVKDQGYRLLSVSADFAWNNKSTSTREVSKIRNIKLF